jgi:hypothetical protein
MLQAATDENQAEGMEKFFAHFKGKFLIGGDFNGHHHSWGNSKICTIAYCLHHRITELETNITFLNDGSQIRVYISDATGSKAALDQTFVDTRPASLGTWKDGTDAWISDHYPITIEYKGTIEPGKCNKKASRLHNKNTDWTAFMEDVKEKITEVKTHNGWKRERDMKEMYKNCIQMFKGKLEETTAKRKNNQSVYGETENAIR